MRSSIEWNGEGETFGGIVVIFGMNALNVIDGVKKKLAEISGSPPGVEIVSEYDRSGLIQNKRDLIEASSPAKPSPAVTISQPETRRCQEVDAGRASEAHQSAAIARRATSRLRSQRVGRDASRQCQRHRRWMAARALSRKQRKAEARLA